MAVGALTALGVASVNASAQETDWSAFQVSYTSVRKADVSNQLPGGLRFRVDCPVDYHNNDAVECYTTLTLTTGGTVYRRNVSATVWRTDGSGWNTVIVDIPASDYTTEISAQAFVVMDDATYQTEVKTTTIAKTASWVLNFKPDEDGVAHYVAGKVQNISLNRTAALMTAGDTFHLSATTYPSGYGVVWSSSNDTVVRVDKNGTATALANGTATITASIGGKSASCTLSVSATQGVQYQIADSGEWAEVVGYTGADGQVVIADTYADLPVKAIANGAFSGKTQVRAVYLPDGLTTIGANAFYGATGLTSVVIPTALSSIGQGAFNGCTALKSLYYKGTATEWQTVSIAADNSALSSATRYDYSATKPTKSGSYWCYDENGEIKVWPTKSKEDEGWTDWVPLD